MRPFSLRNARWRRNPAIAGRYEWDVARYILFSLLAAVLLPACVAGDGQSCFVLEQNPNLANDMDFNVQDCRFARD